MVDPIAIWGAITGSTAVALSLRREVISNRRRLRVDFGWNWFVDRDSGELNDYWIYVMVQNTGGRDITVMHVGLGWAAAPVEGETIRGRRVYEGHRVEFALDNPIHLKVDGPPVKVDTPAGPLLHLFDPFETPVQPMAYTGGGNELRLGEPTPFLRRPPDAADDAALRRGLARLRDRSDPPIPSTRGGLWAVGGYVRGIEPDMSTIIGARHSEPDDA